MKTFTITEDVSKGIEMRVGEEGILGIPLGQGISKDIEHLPKGTKLKLHNLDVVQRETEGGIERRLVREQDDWRDKWRNKRALVLLVAAYGPGGSVGLFANTVEEIWNPQGTRVMRRPPSVETALGVSVLGQMRGEGYMEYLISMCPGASFRMCRTGDLHGAPPELVISWKGRWNEHRVLQPGGRDDVRNWGMVVYKREIRHGEVA